MKLGIAMIPSLEAMNAVIALQKTLLPFYSLSPLLGTQHNLPHITLLQGRFKNDTDWVSLFSDLHNYCCQQKYLLEFQTTGLEYQLPGWLFLKLEPNILLFDAQRFIFERLKDSMFLIQEDYLKDTSSYSLLERQNYFIYGYRYIGQSFHPHITLGKIINNYHFLNKADVYNLDIFNFKIEGLIQKITLYEMGENGSHANTLYALDI